MLRQSQRRTERERRERRRTGVRVEHLQLDGVRADVEHGKSHTGDLPACTVRTAHGCHTNRTTESRAGSRGRIAGRQGIASLQLRSRSRTKSCAYADAILAAENRSTV